MTNNEDYYLNLSLPPVPPVQSETETTLFALLDQLSPTDERDQLKALLQKIITSYTKKHESLRHALEDVQESKKQLQSRLTAQSQQFNRSLKETEHYKNLYESIKYSRRRSTLVSSNASCLSGRSYTSSSARSSSSSSMRYSLVDEVIDPVLFDRHLYIDSDTEDHQIDLYSVLSESEDVPPPPDIPLEEDEKSEELLTFACGDGFWNTIANGKLNKPEVDTLIR